MMRKSIKKIKKAFHKKMKYFYQTKKLNGLIIIMIVLEGLNLLKN